MIKVGDIVEKVNAAGKVLYRCKVTALIPGRFYTKLEGIITEDITGYRGKGEDCGSDIINYRLYKPKYQRNLPAWW